MRVIAEGKKKWTKTFSCKSCNAVLEAEKDDIIYRVTDTHTETQQYNTEIEGDFLVACPECGLERKITDVPLAIKEEIKSR
jgi:rubredoxin